MRLNVFDPNTLDLIGVISNYTSVQWQPTFNTADGSFQLNCSTDYKELLQIERFIENTSELEHIGVIKSIQTLTSNEETSLVVQGVMLEKDIFYKRVMKAWIMYYDMYPINALSQIIALSMVDPAEPDRKMDILGEITYPSPSDIADTEKTQYSANYPNLGDEVFSLIQGMDIGVKASLNRTTKKIDITFYTGDDYTFGSDDAIVFSPERGTVLETTYSIDSSQNFNHVVLVGEDNVILEAERERDDDEPIIEKSIDVSNDIPWPTIQVEKPEEEGGQYYRYKKYDPPVGFITNRDVWEKYEVEKIVSQETRYRQVESSGTTQISTEKLLKNSQLLTGGKFETKTGEAIGSSVDPKQAIKDYENSPDASHTWSFVGYIRNTGALTSGTSSTTS